eukprot:2043896-Pleurochrysis_carterae.AAC.1
MASAAVPAWAGLLMPLELTSSTLWIALGAGFGRSLLGFALRPELVLRINQQRAAVRPVQFQVALDFTSLHRA